HQRVIAQSDCDWSVIRSDDFSRLDSFTGLTHCVERNCNCYSGSKYGDLSQAKPERDRRNNLCFLDILESKACVRAQAFEHAIQRPFHVLERARRQPQNVFNFDLVAFHDFFPVKETLNNRFRRALARYNDTATAPRDLPSSFAICASL